MSCPEIQWWSQKHRGTHSQSRQSLLARTMDTNQTMSWQLLWCKLWGKKNKHQNPTNSCLCSYWLKKSTRSKTHVVFVLKELQIKKLTYDVQRPFIISGQDVDKCMHVAYSMLLLFLGVLSYTTNYLCFPNTVQRCLSSNIFFPSVSSHRNRTWIYNWEFDTWKKNLFFQIALHTAKWLSYSQLDVRGSEVCTF